MATLPPPTGLMRRRKLQTMANAGARPAPRPAAPATFTFPTVGPASGQPGVTSSGASGGSTSSVIGGYQPQPAPQPVATTINTQVDPNVTAAYGDIQGRIKMLQGTEDEQLNPQELQRRITLANTSAADAAQGDKAQNAERAAILGRGPEGAALYDRRTSDTLQRTMARQGEEITAQEQRRIDDRNEARRRELNQLIMQQLEASTVAPRLALSEQDQSLRALEGDRGYGLSLEELRQRGLDRDWSRSQALSQMTLDNNSAGAVGPLGTPPTSYYGGGTGTGRGLFG